MTHLQVERLERSLRIERARLERELARLVTSDEPSGGHGRFADDVVDSTVGDRAEVDRAVADGASRELADVERALALLYEDPANFGVCTTCQRPIPLARLRLVPWTRYCRSHAPI